MFGDDHPPRWRRGGTHLGKGLKSAKTQGPDGPPLFDCCTDARCTGGIIGFNGAHRVHTLAAIVLAAAVGCSSAVPGTAVKARGGPAPGTVDVNLLGPGNFPTKPAPPLGTAGSPAQGALIEARRMASYVIGPWEVDSGLGTPSPVRAMVLQNPAAVAVIEPAGVGAATQAHNFVNGFASDRQGPHQQRLMNAVLRFTDAASAAAAAAEMAKAATMAQPGTPPPVPIPGHPEALAATYSLTSFGGDQHPVTVVSYTPHGAYVLCQITQADQADAAAALIAKTLDIQGPRIDRFIPSDPAQFANLPADPTGLLTHTMPAPNWPPDPKGTGPANPKIGVYQPDAALHFQDNPPSAAAALSIAGVQLVSYNQSLVYQARDAAAAAQLAQDLPDLVLQLQPTAMPIGGVDFMPASRCVQSDRPGGSGKIQYTCYAPVNAYTIEVHAADATGARQETAAQYKILLAK